MTKSHATVVTPNASRYLQQLCKHWSHKFTVDFTPEQGSIALPLGLVRLLAIDEELAVDLTAANENTDMGAFETVVAEHLKRFGFREQLTFDWRRTEAAVEAA